jgi:hypothetical protein
VSEGTAAIVAHAPAPGVIGIVLSRTQPVTVASNMDERPIAVTVATRKGCKAGFVGCSGVGADPMCGSGFF